VQSVGVFEAKNRLTALLDEVEQGHEILITRRGKPVARLVPAESGFDRVKARRAAVVGQFEFFASEKLRDINAFKCL